MIGSSLYPPRKYKQFVPQKSGLHRQAVFALFRALLSQCSTAPFDNADRCALKNIVRNRFEANRHLRGPRRLKLSFYAGYKALDYLDEAVAGETASVERIAGYLSKVPQYLKQPPRVKLPPPKRIDPPYVTPPEHQFFNIFPRQTVEGERRVPHFVRANGFPMVRWKKPQPNRLTRTIRQLIEAKQKSMDYQMEYEEHYIPMAQHEDQWDLIVQHQMGEVQDEDEETWTKQATRGLNYIKTLRVERHQRTMEKAHRMVEIVEKEQELADKESAERVRLRGKRLN